MRGFLKIAEGIFTRKSVLHWGPIQPSLAQARPSAHAPPDPIISSLKGKIANFDQHESASQAQADWSDKSVFAFRLFFFQDRYAA